MIPKCMRVMKSGVMTETEDVKQGREEDDVEADENGEETESNAKGEKEQSD